MSKLTKEDKIEIYERRLKGETIPALAKTFNITESKVLNILFSSIDLIILLWSSKQAFLISKENAPL